MNTLDARIDLDPLQRLADATSAALGLWSGAFVCLAANRALETDRGVGSGGLLGRSYAEVYGAECWALDEALLRAALGGTRQRFKRLRRGADGRARPVWVDCSPAPGAVGEPVGLVTLAIDAAELPDAAAAAERDRAHDLLRQSEAALQQAQRLGEIGSWQWEVETDIVSWSAELYRIYDYDPSRLPPRYDQHVAFYMPASQAVLRAAVERALRHGEPYVNELEFVGADGQPGWIEGRGQVERDADGKVSRLHGTAQVVTARHRMQQALRERDRLLLCMADAGIAPPALGAVVASHAAVGAALGTAPADSHAALAESQAALAAAHAALATERARHDRLQRELEQAKKTEVLGHLAGGIAHDFNNVLAAVSGAFHVLGRTVTDPKSLEFIARGRRGVERATRLVRQLMGFARTQALDAQVLDVNAALAGCRDLLQVSVGARVVLAIEPGATWQTLIDPSQLEIALLNLSLNARDAMPDGGRLVIRTRDVAAAAGLPERVAIEVVDAGEGMPAEVLERAREPFFTTKPAGQGTGLGLAMVSAFVHQSGGAFELASTPGAGTVATLLLPRATGRPGAVSEAPGNGLAPVVDRHLHGHAAILVVDDDPLVRPVTAQYLRELGYAVSEADGGAEALRLAGVRTDFDLVVTDVAMPNMDGTALAARLRERHPALAVLMITGQADRRLLAGEDVIDKPFTQPDLAARVLALLGRNAPVRPFPAARIRHADLRALFQRWEALRDGMTLPTVAALALDDCAGTEHVFVAEVIAFAPFAFRRTRVGTALTQQLENAVRDESPADAHDDAFGGLEAAYRRCVRMRAPSYEYVRFNLDSGKPVLFERLLLPCADASGMPNYLLGMVMFDNASNKR